MTDPTAPLRERTPEQVAAFMEDHLIMALVGADHLTGDRAAAVVMLLARFAAVKGSWPDPEALAAEDSRRRFARLTRVVTGPEVPQTPASTRPHPPGVVECPLCLKTFNIPAGFELWFNDDQPDMTHKHEARPTLRPKVV